MLLVSRDVDGTVPGHGEQLEEAVWRPDAVDGVEVVDGFVAGFEAAGEQRLFACGECGLDVVGVRGDRFAPAFEGSRAVTARREAAAAGCRQTEIQATGAAEYG